MKSARVQNYYLLIESPKIVTADISATVIVIITNTDITSVL